MSFLPGAEVLPLLRELTDQYGQSQSKRGAVYRRTSRRTGPRTWPATSIPAEEPRLSAALGARPRGPARGVRAWSATRNGTLPVQAVDLRTDGDWRIRAAVLQALTARDLRKPDSF